MRPTPGAYRVWCAVSVALAGTILWATPLATQSMASQLAVLLVLTVVAGGAWVACWRSPSLDLLPLGMVLCTLLLLRGVALTTSPLLEDDHFRYLWDGFMTATTGQPYRHEPARFFSDPRVPAHMQAVLDGINHPELPTIYGPALQALFALSHTLAPAQLWPFKLMLLGAEVLVLLLLHRGGVRARWLLLWVLHPMVVKESAITAHPDVLIGLAWLAAVLAWMRGREALAAVCVSLAVAVKVSALIALPLFFLTQRGRISIPAVAASLLTLAACYAPFVWLSGAAELRAVAAFGEQWTFNPLLFRAVGWVFPDAVARAVVAGLFALLWCVVVFRWWRSLRALPSEHRPIAAPPLVVITVALLMLSPALNPWYWLWILPLATWRFSTVVWVAATVSLLAYAHVVTPVLQGSSMITYAVPMWATLAQVFAIGATAVWRWFHTGVNNAATGLRQQTQA